MKRLLNNKVRFSNWIPDWIGNDRMGNCQQKTRLSAGFLTECNTDVLRLDLSVSTLSQKALLVKFLHSNVDLTGIEPANSDSSDLNVHQYQAHKFIIAFVWFLGFLIWNLLLPTPAFAANSGIFTVSLWVKPTSTIASQALVGKAEELRVFTDASGNAGCQIKSTTWQTASTGTTALTLNSWNHVACTYDKVKLTVYVNGTQTSQTSLTSQIDDTSNALLLGQDSSASTPYSNLTGTTDDFKFYNYARTQKQVTEDAGGGHPAVLAGSSGPSSVIASGARQSGPVGYWKFDEGYGTTAHNSGSQGETLQGSLSGFASPATTTSGWTQAGKFGRALNFDVSGDYVTVPYNSALNPTTAVSVTAWIKTSATGRQDIATRFNANSPYAGYALVMAPSYGCGSSNGQLGFWVGDNTSKYVCSTRTYNDGQWHHVVGSYDGTTAYLYVDGILQTSASRTNGLNNTSSALNIGASYDGVTSPFNGTIDEVKIYPYALTADEVKLDYNKGSAQVLGALSDNSSSSFTSSSSVQGADHEYCIPGDATSCAAPVGRWDFDEGAGTSVKDVSGNGYNGTITGATYKVGKIGKALNFNGSSDVVDTISSISGIKTISFWVNPSTTTQNLIDLQTTPSAINVSVSGGALSATGFTSPTYYINGVATATPTLTANTWSHVEITTGTAITGSAIRFGRISTTSLTGKLDNIRFFNYARSAAQVAWDYNRGAPLAHWKFNECQGDTAHDSSGNSNHGTITATSTLGKCSTASTFWGGSGGTGAGKFNYAPTFNGTGDYVDVGKTIGSLVSGDGSVCWWIKPATAYNDNTQRVMWGASTGASIPEFSAQKFNDNNLYIGWNSSGQDDRVVVAASATNYPQNQWVHYCFTWVPNGTSILHINGVSVGTTSSTTVTTPSTNFLIGKHGGFNSYFNGQIDDVRVYNYALTALQVKLLSNQGAAVRYGPFLGVP